MSVQYVLCSIGRNIMYWSSWGIHYTYTDTLLSIKSKVNCSILGMALLISPNITNYLQFNSKIEKAGFVNTFVILLS
jgi:hypothetical protein